MESSSKEVPNFSPFALQGYRFIVSFGLDYHWLETEELLQPGKFENQSLYV